eukprot:TRINITY_DN26114_c0_g1_i1.p1 TRINITY_DN26114_c0_g1~~TRINITY_DN26114_c0_g1_i1.p1  ORF type:complete len:635 (+),score=90.53 TRINITY_DN26114_c0_g1_i1:49-1905(+)
METLKNSVLPSVETDRSQMCRNCGYTRRHETAVQQFFGKIKAYAGSKEVEMCGRCKAELDEVEVPTAGEKATWRWEAKARLEPCGTCGKKAGSVKELKNCWGCGDVTCDVCIEHSRGIKGYKDCGKVPVCKACAAKLRYTASATGRRAALAGELLKKIRNTAASSTTNDTHKDDLLSMTISTTITEQDLEVTFTSDSDGRSQVVRLNPTMQEPDAWDATWDRFKAAQSEGSCPTCAKEPCVCSKYFNNKTVPRRPEILIRYGHDLDMPIFARLIKTLTVQYLQDLVTDAQIRFIPTIWGLCPNENCLAQNRCADRSAEVGKGSGGLWEWLSLYHNDKSVADRLFIVCRGCGARMLTKVMGLDDYEKAKDFLKKFGTELPKQEFALRRQKGGLEVILPHANVTLLHSLASVKDIDNYISRLCALRSDWQSCQHVAMTSHAVYCKRTCSGACRAPYIEQAAEFDSFQKPETVITDDGVVAQLVQPDDAAATVYMPRMVDVTGTATVTEGWLVVPGGERINLPATHAAAVDGVVKGTTKQERGVTWSSSGVTFGVLWRGEKLCLWRTDETDEYSLHDADVDNDDYTVVPKGHDTITLEKESFSKMLKFLRTAEVRFEEYNS